MKKWWSNLDGKVRLFMLIAFVFGAGLFVVDCICRENKLEFWENILVELHGMFFDTILFGILLTVYENIVEKKNTIKRLHEEIDDYRGWNEPEATYRIVGCIKRLNKLNETEIALYGCYLKRANLIGANLAGANLTGADLTGADLTGANLTCANLGGAYLSGAYLAEANLSMANLSMAELNGTNLFKANLRMADLSGVYLNDVNLYEANLFRAYLAEAKLSEANFTKADLTESDLRGMNIFKVNFSGTKLSGAKIESEEKLEVINKILRSYRQKEVTARAENDYFVIE